MSTSVQALEHHCVFPQICDVRWGPWSVDPSGRGPQEKREQWAQFKAGAGALSGGNVGVSSLKSSVWRSGETVRGGREIK